MAELTHLFMDMENAVEHMTQTQCAIDLSFTKKKAFLLYHVTQT